jgi:predicted DNA-binding protein (MmcQ/YjbR family)
MNIEELREYCINKEGAAEDFPFDETTLVFKVAGKMFALTDLEGELSVNLKCTPDIAIELRERYQCVRPGYHMNKKHWNTIDIDGSVSDDLIREWVDLSYNLVVSRLSKKARAELKKK